MVDVETSDRYDHWISSLRDRTTAATVSARIERAGRGLLAGVESVGAGVNELRIDHGPGYRVYFTCRGKTLILLLCGGNKSTQAAHIRIAKAMAGQLQPASGNTESTNLPLETTPCDAAKHLDTDEAIAAFLPDAFESGDDGAFQDAMTALGVQLTVVPMKKQGARKKIRPSVNHPHSGESAGGHG